jgi:hypothetical protein
MKSRIRKLLLFLTILILHIYAEGSLVLVQFTVTDLDGHPVQNAFIEASLPGAQNAEAKTNSAGQATLQLSQTHNLSIEVSHPDYYATGGELWRGGQYLAESGKLVSRLLPEAFTLTLKKIREPVPLLKRSFRGRCPRVTGKVGFDMNANDWVRPYGSGQREDVYFAFTDIVIEDTAYAATLTLSFPDPADGIKPFHAARPYSMQFGSNLAPPHKAPIDGYSPSLRKTIRYQRGDSLSPDDGDQRNFLFRIRSHTDAVGTLHQACYGWIEGEIEFDPRDSEGIQLVFKYHLNPDPSPDQRSLEPMN